MQVGHRLQREENLAGRLSDGLVAAGDVLDLLHDVVGFLHFLGDL